MSNIRNLILCVADSLRRDTAIDVGLQSIVGSVHFECVAAANCTPCCLPTIATGLNPSSHLIHRFDQTLDPLIPNIFTILKAGGYETNYLSLGKDLPITECQQEPVLGFMEFPGDPNKKLEFFLRSDRPFMLLFHFWDTHTPYLLEGKTGEEVDKLFANLVKEGNITEARKIYWDSAVHLRDNKLKPLFELLEKWGRTANTLVVLMGDHGEMLGERYDWAYYGAALEPDSAVNHVGVLIPETIDVPLIFFNPELSVPKEKLVARQVDVVPTILSILGIPYAPQDFDGVNIFEFRGILAGFSIGAHPSPPRHPAKKREEWVSWIDEPLFKRISVRILNDFYVSNEMGEVLADFKSKERIYNDLRMSVMRAYANRFIRGRFKGIVSIKNPLTYGKIAFGGKGAEIIRPEEAAGEEKRKRIEKRLKQLGYES